MKNNFRCIRAIDDAGLFDSNDHRSRFSELMNCYYTYPFFNSGLCKCMYLSSWDMEHFMVILNILNDMTIGRHSDVEEMKDNGKVLEMDSEGYEKHIFQMANAFLNNEAFEIPDEPIAEEGLYIMNHALQAAQIIDEIFASI